MVVWNDDPYLGTWKIAASICQFTALGSARRPCHRPATEQVRVHVPDGLTTLSPGIEHDPVATGVDTFCRGDLVCLGYEFVEQTIARADQRRYVRIVVPRDHQDVRGRLRADITEGDYPLAVQHDRGRDRSGRDPAEQAFWHTTIIVARRQHPVQDLAFGAAGTGDAGAGRPPRRR
jgi:hypothetical protein